MMVHFHSIGVIDPQDMLEQIQTYIHAECLADCRFGCSQDAIM